MLVQMLAARFDAGGVLRAAGAQLDVANDLALRWIGDNAAVPIGNSRSLAQGLRKDVAVMQDRLTGQQYAGDAVVPGLGTESIYTRALYFGTSLSQAGSVKDFSPSGDADAIYVGGISDAEVYDTNVGYLTTLGATAKSLAIPAGKTQCNLANREGLFMQLCWDPGTVTVFDSYCGNGAGATAPGFDVYNHTTAGTKDVRVFVRGQNTGAGNTVGVNAQNVGQYQAGDNWLTFYIDGPTQIANAWVNRKRVAGGINWDIGALNLGATIRPDTPAYFGLGASAGSSVQSTARAMKLKAFRFAVLPPGVSIRNPALLDWRFNVNPLGIVSTGDMVG